MTVDAPMAAHLYRSPLLGTARNVRVEAGDIRVFERGAGPAIVFAHGWLANANLFRNVVARLADRYRCIALDLPLGAHGIPVDREADLSPPGCGAIIVDVIEALGLTDVTLVGNDSGGAYSQVGVAARPERIGRLVLASCETPDDVFPPPPFTGLRQAAASVEFLKGALQGLRSRERRLRPEAFGLLAKHPIPDDVFDSYALPVVEDDRILHDIAKAMRSASETHVRRAADALIADFRKPVLMAWAAEDPVFPLAHAQAYALRLPNARVDTIADAYSFTAEDQPEKLAELIAAFIAETGGGS
ncbi:alpha/beta fold hydrolase [Afipia sp. GAS231]|uniref:alpha/beta fold hydrolase n=1 Tax=Afipia sp. GAS231 TaxID=1882747 RepID=UPI000879E669|nr:alpha/beta hydrolase [Afipia sp. GAS231]SDO58920.1 Pimeloyl-ACP methyl ester carboxylesterase [Afipia sp. GAS231]